MTYYKGQIIVGKGRTPGKNTVLQTKADSSKRGVLYYSFASSSGLARVRNITTEKGVRYTTADRYSANNLKGRFIWPEAWQFSDKDQAAITFKAKALHGITIGLSKNQSSAAEYVITIGANANTSTVITKGKPVITVEEEHARITNTKEFMPYWIAYQRGYLMVGHGDTIGEKIILRWHDPFPRSVMKYVSFTSGHNQVSYQDIAINPLNVQLNNTDSFVANGKISSFHLVANGRSLMIPVAV